MVVVVVPAPLAARVEQAPPARQSTLAVAEPAVTEGRVATAETVVAAVEDLPLAYWNGSDQRRS